MFWSVLDFVVPTRFICSLFARQKINPAVLQWEWWRNDCFSKAVWAFSSGTLPSPASLHHWPLPAHHPTTGRPPRGSSLSPSNMWRVGFTWRKKHYVWITSKRGQKRGLPKVEYYNPYSNLATGNRARKNSVIRYDAFPPEIINSNPVQGKHRICWRSLY